VIRRVHYTALQLNKDAEPRAAADALAQSLSLVVAALGWNETAPLEIFVA
jgi:hypothetical protein